MKIITIKSSVLATALIAIMGASTNSAAGVFDQLAAVANSALPAYGRVQVMNHRSDLKPDQIDNGLREAITVATDRVIEEFMADTINPTTDQPSLSSDLRRARKTAVKMGHEIEFERLQRQVIEAVLNTVPLTGELLKAAVERVEFTQPRSLLVSHDTAATDFLRHRITANLERNLQPLVQKALVQTGAAKTSASLASKINFGSLLDSIVANHVIEQCVDGFFDKLEVHETAIRHNPASRTTTVLKNVFG